MEIAILLLPLIASIISGFFGRYIGDRTSEIITSLFVIISAVLSLFIFYSVIVSGYENNVVILCESWKGKEREALGYSQALKHIDLVENEGYRYQVFNMIHGGHDSNGRSKIAGIDPVLRNAIVRKEGVDWIATVSQ